jgi:hypothetical protein
LGNFLHPNPGFWWRTLCPLKPFDSESLEIKASRFILFFLGEYLLQLHSHSFMSGRGSGGSKGGGGSKSGGGGSKSGGGSSAQSGGSAGSQGGSSHAQANADNRSNQLNPNSDAYWSSRG